MHTVAINVGKRHHVAMILDANGQQVGKALCFANDQAGFGQLLDWLATVGEVALIGLEATGHYWLALYAAVAAVGYNLVVLNALQIHAYRKSASARMTGMTPTGLPIISASAGSHRRANRSQNGCNCGN